MSTQVQSKVNIFRNKDLTDSICIEVYVNKSSQNDTFYDKHWFNKTFFDLCIYLYEQVSNSTIFLNRCTISYPSRAHEFIHGFLVGSVLLVFCVVLLYVFTFWGQVRFPHKHVSSLPSVVCRRDQVWHYLCLFAHSGVFLFCLSSSCAP